MISPMYLPKNESDYLILEPSDFKSRIYPFSYGFSEPARSTRAIDEFVSFEESSDLVSYLILIVKKV